MRETSITRVSNCCRPGAGVARRGECRRPPGLHGPVGRESPIRADPRRRPSPGRRVPPPGPSRPPPGLDRPERRSPAASPRCRRCLMPRAEPGHRLAIALQQLSPLQGWQLAGGSSQVRKRFPTSRLQAPMNCSYPLPSVKPMRGFPGFCGLAMATGWEPSPAWLDPVGAGQRPWFSAILRRTTGDTSGPSG